MSSTPADAGRRFRFRPWLTLAVLLSLALLLSLGTWQVQRLRWKQALIATAETQLAQAPAELPPGTDLAGADYRRFTVRGRYLHEAALAFGLRASGNEPGAHLITPFRLTDGRTILVDRGWLPERLLPPAVPAGAQPAGELTREGVARWRAAPTRTWLTPADQPDRRRWFGWDIPAMAAATGEALVPLVLVLDRSEGPDGLPRAAPVRAEFTNNHLGYAVTWYGLAAALVAIYLVFSFTPHHERPAP